MKNPLQKDVICENQCFTVIGLCTSRVYTHILFRILRTSFDRGDFWMNSVGYVLSLSVISLEKNKDLKDDALKLSNILRVLDWVFTTEIFNISPKTMTRWWFQIFFYVHPYLRKISNLTNTFHMGWNHQPDDYFNTQTRMFLVYLPRILDSLGGKCR